jgi:hypothetical protein
MSEANLESCVEIASGGVGESGASSILVHKHDEAAERIAVLRNVESSLCPNTSAVAMLVVNGQPTAQGDLTAVGSSIQSNVATGDVIAAIIHTVPKFNDISCVRLGELSVVLSECELTY